MGGCEAWNIGLWPVRPADILAAVIDLSGVQLRWAHRLKVYVPAAQIAQGDICSETMPDGGILLNQSH